MKILLVTHAFPPEGVGGTERYAEAVARALAGRGHALEVFSGSLEWRPEFRVEARDEAGLRVTRVHRSDLYFDHWDKTQNPHVARVFEETLARLQPDVIHLHHWIRLSNDLVRRAAARGVPTLVHLHDLFVTCPRVFRVKGAEESCELPLSRDACVSCVPRWKFQSDGEIGASVDFYREELGAELRAARGLLAPTATHGRFLAQHAGLPETAIGVLAHPRLPGGIQGRGTDAGSPAGRLRLLYFSHLLPMKGAHVVIEALRQLRQADGGSDGNGRSNGGVSLDLHGPFASTDYEQRLRGLATGLEVRFHGAYGADEPCRTPADVAVVPSLARESWSFWLDEAGRLGLPILAADSGALVERATGRVRLYAARDVAALAQAIHELRDEPGLRATMAAAPAPEGMALADHVERLERDLIRVAGAPPSPPAPPPPDPRALVHEWDRRELAFRELLRSEGWETVVGQQHAELDRLRRELAALRGRSDS